MGASNPSVKIDIDFSLAIYNRTGKYFIGRDIIESFPEIINNIYYGLTPRKRVPAGLIGKVSGRLQHLQIMNRTTARFCYWPARPHARRPILHLDPLTVGGTALHASDAVLCHDVGPLTHPELFDRQAGAAYRSIYRRIAEIGPHMIFVSEASRRAFHETTGHSRFRSEEVVYPPLRAEVADLTETAIEGVAAPFLLTVGALGLRKNQLRCMAAFERSGLARKGVRYILCGAMEPGADLVVAAARRTPGVILLNYVSDGELAWLYRRARGFVLPSLLEGFGMPLAEAIARDQIPLITAGGVLEEVAGEGALGVDAESEEAIALGMRRLIEMTEDERAMRLRSLRTSIARFSDRQFTDGWRTVLHKIATAC